VLAAGDYTLTEAAAEGWFNQGGYVSTETDGCDDEAPSTGTTTSLDVTIAAGETTIVCWYNVPGGTLRIHKNATGSDTFAFSVDGDELGEVTAGDYEDFTLPVGATTLTEVFSTGWTNRGGYVTDDETCATAPGSLADDADADDTRLAGSLAVTIVAGETTVVCWYNAPADTYSFVRVAAQNNNAETAEPGPIVFEKDKGDFKLYFVLYAGDTRVDSCAVAPDLVKATLTTATSGATSPIQATASGCEYVGASARWVYAVTLANPLNNSPTSGSIVVTIDGETVATYDYETD
jgi:hypothetical protein